jgi:hypothetical protein
MFMFKRPFLPVTSTNIHKENKSKLFSIAHNKNDAVPKLCSQETYCFINLVRRKRMRGGTKVMPLFFRKVIAITLKFAWMIRTSFTVTRLFFHNGFAIFNTLLPTLSKTLYTSVTEFCAATSEHITSGTREL